MGTYIKALNPSQLVLDQLGILEEIALPNPRKIKRILNILNVTSAIIDATPGLGALSTSLVARLVVLQVQSGDLYQKFLEIPDLLVALESVYRMQRDPDNASHFEAYGQLRDVVQLTCKEFYQPHSYLAALFKESTFEHERTKLPSYMTMLGG